MMLIISWISRDHSLPWHIVRMLHVDRLLESTFPGCLGVDHLLDVVQIGTICLDLCSTDGVAASVAFRLLWRDVPFMSGLRLAMFRDSYSSADELRWQLRLIRPALVLLRRELGRLPKLSRVSKLSCFSELPLPLHPLHPLDLTSSIDLPHLRRRIHHRPTNHIILLDT